MVRIDHILPWLSILVQRINPVVVIVPLIVLQEEQLPQDLSQEPVVWLVLELQGMDVVEERGYLYGQALTELLHWDVHLLLHYFVVFFLLVVSFDALPG